MMYLQFYGLREKPFSQTPDPRFLYLNDSYQEAIANLRYGIEERKGFVTMIGEAGTGKTTLLRKLLDELGSDVVSVFLFNPNASFDEILEFILHELGIPAPSGKRLAMLQKLNDFLIAAYGEGRNTILLIDEAQDLDEGVLESLRLLSNLETARDKILQIVLSGQPELAAKLGTPHLRQLKQRIAVRCRLEPLRRDELAAYIDSRLRVAGRTEPLFTPGSHDVIWEFSGGIPRLLNMVCDNALLVGYALGKPLIDANTVSEVVADLRKLDFEPPAAISTGTVREAPPQLATGGAPEKEPPTPRVAAPTANPIPAGDLSAEPTPSVATESVPGPASSPEPADLSLALAPETAPVFSPVGQPPSEQARRHVLPRGFLWGIAVLVSIFALGIVQSRRPRDLVPARPELDTAPDDNAAADRAPSEDPSGALPDGPHHDESAVARTIGAPGVTRTTAGSAPPPAAVAPSSSGPDPADPQVGSGSRTAEPVIEDRPPGATESSPSRADGSPTGSAAALDLPEPKKIRVKSGDTLMNLATRHYGSATTTTLDLLKEANPGVTDINRILAGTELTFPEPGGRSRVLAGRSGLAVLVITTPQMARAADTQRRLRDLRGRDSVLQPRDLGNGQVVYRVVVENLQSSRDAVELADGLGSILVEPPL